MKKVFVIIVTYNAMQWIDKCLHCLSQSSIPVVPVLIDNYSTDGTREYIPTHYPDVVWLPQEKNLGFGQGNNVGFKYAMQEKADFVVLLNQDAYLEEHAIESLLLMTQTLYCLHCTLLGTEKTWIRISSITYTATKRSTFWMTC